MTGYSIGLMKFLDEIVLLKKARPECQRGFLNLPGGKIKEGESPRQCIAREWLEKTGIETFESDWQLRLEITGNDYVLYVFATFPLDRCELKLSTDEQSRWYGLSWLDFDKCVPILRWIVPLLLDITTQVLKIRVIGNAFPK